MNILHKIAPSSFCVYLFGLESLAAKSEGFLFLAASKLKFKTKRISLIRPAAHENEPPREYPKRLI